ncbi:hypothetical protein ABDJ41_11270 [Pedobacter sp. ASV1-7]|uniref:hypothetical protein n=1 Tax=Pedobacter sp. ASV1-7 TaxID=3145237 RepID=UPI0032E8FA57
MENLDIQPENFDINISLNGSMKTIQVEPEETTDGAEYFKCNVEGKNITQIRQEKDGSWEQIWGDLSNIDVVNIGKAIAAYKR